MIVKLLTEHHLGVSKLKKRLQRLVPVYTCQNVKLLEISCSNGKLKQKLLLCDRGQKIPAASGGY